MNYFPKLNGRQFGNIIKITMSDGRKEKYFVKSHGQGPLIAQQHQEI